MLHRLVCDFAHLPCHCAPRTDSRKPHEFRGGCQPASTHTCRERTTNGLFICKALWWPDRLASIRRCIGRRAARQNALPTVAGVDEKGPQSVLSQGLWRVFEPPCSDYSVDRQDRDLLHPSCPQQSVARYAQSLMASRQSLLGCGNIRSDTAPCVRRVGVPQAVYRRHSRRA